MNATTSFERNAAEWSEQLLSEGYCIIPDALPRSVVAALQADLDDDFRATPMCQGRFYGDLPRRGIVVGYCLGWLKPYENQWLAYPPPIARTFPRELAELVGYVQHRPNLGNYEGRCPSILLEDDVPTRIGAIDALRPDQEAMLASFADESEP